MPTLPLFTNHKKDTSTIEEKTNFTLNLMPLILWYIFIVFAIKKEKRNTANEL